MSNLPNKYVRFEELGFMIWPRLYPDPNHDPISHRLLARLLAGRFKRAVVSAGFVEFEDGLPRCYGFSSSLGVDSLPEDSELLAKQLGLNERSPTWD